MEKISIGIIGGAGYTAGELLRIVLFHPKVEIKWIYSSSNALKPITEVHDDLLGYTDLNFSDTINPENIDLAFICSGHGKAKEVIAQNPKLLNKKIIDLSTDYRMAGNHDFIYGLPELNKKEIQSAQHIANPGCFATAIQLALLPFWKNNMGNGNIHVNAVTGSTGAGQRPMATTHFSWRNNNVSTYKTFEHQHLNEIGQTAKQLANNWDAELFFIPNRGNFSRGILATAYSETDLSEEKLIQLYTDYYKDHPFVTISDKNPHLKQVVNTNKAILHVCKKRGQLLVTSMIDNLAKGASGQAVHNMNLMMGWDETLGLMLKPNAF